MTEDLSLLLGRSAQAIRDDPEEAKSRFRAASKTNDPNPPCPHCGKRHRTLTEDQCLDRSRDENDWLKPRVLYRAKKYGWTVAHAGRGSVSERPDGTRVWITPMAEGWPDLSCFKAGHRPIFLELKRELNDAEEKQVEWLQLMAAAGCGVGIIRPSDLREKRVDAIFKRGFPITE